MKYTLPINTIFQTHQKLIIGVVHLLPLPGSPLYNGDLKTIINQTIADAKNLERGGVHGIIIENFMDYPFVKRVRDPVTISAFTLVAYEVAKSVKIPIGINILRNSAIEAAAIACTIGAKFIRVNAYVETVATDSGIIEPAAPSLLRYLRQINCKLGILADIHVKHGKVIGERSIFDTVKDAIYRGQASAVIITGTRTGAPPPKSNLMEAKKAGAYVLIGSGFSPEHIDLLEIADGTIVGTYLKKDGLVYNPVDFQRVKNLINRIKLAFPLQ